MSVYFMRHGQCRANMDHLHASLDSPLTRLGREQAGVVGQKVAFLNVSIIIASDLPRAIETAQIVADRSGFDKNQIISEPLLREVGNGDLAGKPDGTFRDFLRHEANGDPTLEPLTHARQRAQQLIGKLRKYQSHNVLLVSHGGFGLILQEQLAGDAGNLMEPDNIPNAELIELFVSQTEKHL